MDDRHWLAVEELRDRIKELEAENNQLKAEVARLKSEIEDIWLDAAVEGERNYGTP